MILVEAARSGLFPSLALGVLAIAAALQLSAQTNDQLPCPKSVATIPFDEAASSALKKAQPVIPTFNMDSMLTTVWVDVCVSETGEVIVLNSSGHPALELAAIDAAKK